MLKRTIYVGTPSYLRLENNQLNIEAKNGELKGKVPIEDIAILMLDHFQITLTSQLILKLQGNGVVIIACDEYHLPYGLMLPIYGHTEYSKRINIQIQASEPLKKHLWKQTVIQKIKNQQGLLNQLSKPSKQMESHWSQTKSGDPTNTEGKAAQFYWKHLLLNFTRDQNDTGINSMLNFGYSVLRSIVARAIVSSGLSPVFGIFHHNKYNPYCLADDLMEPYRPYVDKLVVDYLSFNPTPLELNKEVKAALLKIATEDVVIGNNTRPLMVAVSITTASLFKCFNGEQRKLKYPCLNNEFKSI